MSREVEPLFGYTWGTNEVAPAQLATARDRGQHLVGGAVMAECTEFPPSDGRSS